MAAAILGLLLELDPSPDRQTGNSLYQEAKTVIGNDQAFWAGQVSHIGVVLVAVGIAFAANLLHSEVELMRGESVEFAGYTLTYDAPFRRDEPNRVVQGARVEVSRDDRIITVLEPRRTSTTPRWAGSSPRRYESAQRRPLPDTQEPR